MRYRLVLRTLVTGVFCAALVKASTREAVSPATTVRDLIELTRFAEERGRSDVFVRSPDGAHMVVVMKHGNLRSNTCEYELLVFNGGSFVSTAKPIIAAQFASDSNRPGIQLIKWVSDTELMFLGEKPGDLPQIQRLDIDSKRLTQITQATSKITAFAASSNGEVVVFATERPTNQEHLREMRDHGFVITPDSWVSDILSGRWEPRVRNQLDPKTPDALHVLRQGQAEQVIPLNNTSFDGVWLSEEVGWRGLSIAPDGNVALIRAYLRSIPASWAEYKNDEFKDYAASEGVQYLTVWAIVDLRTGVIRPLSSTPDMDGVAMPMWLPDSQSVVLTNSLLPLNVSDPAERERRSTRRMTAEFMIANGQATVVDPREGLRIVSWNPKSSTIVLSVEGTSDESHPRRVCFVKSSAGWTISPPESGDSVTSNFDLRVVQGLNTAWKLEAFNQATGESHIIYDPNAGSQTISGLSRVTVHEWQTKDGSRWKGGLFWPQNYQKGQHYPLVIQTHGFNETQFAPTGLANTGYAAQPLAAAGVMVLQISASMEAHGHLVTRVQDEGSRNQGKIETAIDSLDKLDLIDRERIGLQGWSRTCYHVLFFLTHSKYHVAAATVSEGNDFGYLQYMMFSSTRHLYDSTYGGMPVGESLKAWIESAPGFNLQNVNAPVHMTALGSFSGAAVLAAWEPLIGLSIQRKPVELVYLPEAAHDIIKPWEQFTSQQNNTVDWYRFWLQSYERTEPVTEAGETAETLSKQYSRWHKLRALRDARVKESD